MWQGLHHLLTGNSAWSHLHTTTQCISVSFGIIICRYAHYNISARVVHVAVHISPVCASCLKQSYSFSAPFCGKHEVGHQWYSWLGTQVLVPCKLMHIWRACKISPTPQKRMPLGRGLFCTAGPGLNGVFSLMVKFFLASCKHGSRIWMQRKQRSETAFNLNLCFIFHTDLDKTYKGIVSLSFWSLIYQFCTCIILCLNCVYACFYT